MTEEIKTGNEVIAKFMGVYRDNPEYFRNTYDTSWDWLMPVVEKITPIAKQMGQIAWFDVRSHLLDANIEVVYKAVLEFINWYTSNKK